MWPRLLNTALGVWLMFAPAVLGYSTSDAVASGADRIIGPLVISAAIASIWDEIRPLRWVNVALGVLLALAPLVLGPFLGWPLAGAVNAVVCGLAISALGLVRGDVTNEFGGGWRSLWRDDVDTVTHDPYA